MESKIKEVQDYFKNKIFAGDFAVGSTTEHTIKLIVDSEYSFQFLVGNFPPSMYDNCFIRFDMTREEKDELKLLIDPIMKTYKINVLLQEKRDELAKLEKELQ